MSTTTVGRPLIGGSRAKYVVSATLIAKPVFSNKRRPLSLRVGVEVEVIAPPDILEALNYPRSLSEVVRVCREIPSISLE